MHEEHYTGRAYLEAVTVLLRRVRHAHPTKGLFEAADLQWWWRSARRTDEIAQLFWCDDDGRPHAAAILTAWSSSTAFTPIVMPDADPEWTAHVIERGLEHAGRSGFDAVELEVDRADAVSLETFRRRGFEVTDDEYVETWLGATARPDVAALRAGYHLVSRADDTSRAHHLTTINGPDVERRLGETTLYRPDLDLVVLDDDGHDAAYGLFWYDPETATGLVEPMRTVDEHQRRGLARHVLTTGIDRLARAGVERIKVIFEAANTPARDLYLGVGFEPVKTTVVVAGPTG